MCPQAATSLRPDAGYGNISDGDFSRLSAVVQTTLGIKMPPSKKTMIQARLSRRLRELKLPSYRAYCEYLLTDAGLDAEMVHFLDLATTNKTSFFREDDHFKFLQSKGIGDLVALNAEAGRRRVEVWSAGCSTGEEPHTLAMVMDEWLSARAPGWEFNVLGTDVSTRVLHAARQGVYTEEVAETIPMPLRKRYLLRSKKREERSVRIVPTLRARIHFRHLNLMDDDYRVREPISLIFFRNVMIYFDRPTQEAVVRKLCRSLVPGGYFMCSLAESLHGLDVPLEPAGRSIFRRV